MALARMDGRVPEYMEKAQKWAEDNGIVTGTSGPTPFIVNGAASVQTAVITAR